MEQCAHLIKSTLYPLYFRFMACWLKDHSAQKLCNGDSFAGRLFPHYRTFVTGFSSQWDVYIAFIRNQLQHGTCRLAQLRQSTREKITHNPSRYNLSNPYQPKTPPHSHPHPIPTVKKGKVMQRFAVFILGGVKYCLTNSRSAVYLRRHVMTLEWC